MTLSLKIASSFPEYLDGTDRHVASFVFIIESVKKQAFTAENR